jgi:hypothetical protein
MDKYDYIEILYRAGLFLIAASASFFIVQLAINSAKLTYHGLGMWVYAIIVIVAWLIFMVAVLSYLIFIAKGSFRPANPDDIGEEDGNSIESDVL